MLANGTAVPAAPIPASAMYNCPAASAGSASAVPCAGGSTNFKACLPQTFTVCSVQRGPPLVVSGVSSFDPGSILHTTGAKGSFVDVVALSPPNYTVAASVNNVALAPATSVPSGSWFYTCLANAPNAAVAGSTCTLTVNGAPLGCTGVTAQSFGGALAVNHNLFLNNADTWAIAEVLVYSRALSSAEVASVNNYLATRYQIGTRPPSPPGPPPPNPRPPPSPAPPSVQISPAFMSGMVARYTPASFRASNASRWVRAGGEGFSLLPGNSPPRQLRCRGPVQS